MYIRVRDHIVLATHYHTLQVLESMGKAPKLRLPFLNSIQICRPNDPSTLVKTPLTYFPSHSHSLSKTYDISLPTFPDPPSTPHHKRNPHSSNTIHHPCTMHHPKSGRDDDDDDDGGKFHHSPSPSRNLHDEKEVLMKKPSFKNSCSSSQMEEGPLETRVRTRRFKRYGSKDWRDGSTAKPENEPSEKAVSGRPRRAVAERHENRSFVVVKRSVDPYQDFKKSILEMILERGIFEPKDLEQLLMSFLSLNSRMHHKAILKAFSEIWKEVFSGPSNQS